MANHPSAKKRTRRNNRRALINRTRISRIRTFIRKAEAAIATGNKIEAMAAFNAAVPELMRGVNKSVIHCNKAARKISRLSARVKSL